MVTLAFFVDRIVEIVSLPGRKGKVLSTQLSHRHITSAETIVYISWATNFLRGLSELVVSLHSWWEVTLRTPKFLEKLLDRSANKTNAEFCLRDCSGYCYCLKQKVKRKKKHMWIRSWLAELVESLFTVHWQCRVIDQASRRVCLQIDNDVKWKLTSSWLLR